jgi:hypothetical protein
MARPLAFVVLLVLQTIVRWEHLDSTSKGAVAVDVYWCGHGKKSLVRRNVAFGNRHKTCSTGRPRPRDTYWR